MSYFRNLFSALIGRNPQPARAFTLPSDNSAELATTAARAAITTALNDSRFEFRTIGALVKAVGNGATESFVNSVVDGMTGVRRAGGKPHLIGLTSKVGESVRGYSY